MLAVALHAGTQSADLPLQVQALAGLLQLVSILRMHIQSAHLLPSAWTYRHQQLARHQRDERHTFLLNMTTTLPVSLSLLNLTPSL